MPASEEDEDEYEYVYEDEDEDEVKDEEGGDTEAAPVVDAPRFGMLTGPEKELVTATMVLPVTSKVTMTDPLRTSVIVIWLVPTPSLAATSVLKFHSKAARVLEPAEPARVVKSPLNVSVAASEFEQSIPTVSLSAQSSVYGLLELEQFEMLVAPDGQFTSSAAKLLSPCVVEYVVPDTYPSSMQNAVASSLSKRSSQTASQPPESIFTCNTPRLPPPLMRALMQREDPPIEMVLWLLEQVEDDELDEEEEDEEDDVDEEL